MKRIIHGLALTTLSLSLAACGPARHYTLPVRPDEVRDTNMRIGACATSRGLQSSQLGDGLAVTYDPTAWLHYTPDVSGNYVMKITVDEKKVFGSALEKKFNQVKLTGDELFACAQEDSAPPRSAQQPVYQPPSSGLSINLNISAQGSGSSQGSGQGMSASFNMRGMDDSDSDESVSASGGVEAAGGGCAQALSCYAELSKRFCGAGDSNCSFKAEFSGNDESACQDALRRVPRMIESMRMVRPDISAPAVCRLP